MKTKITLMLMFFLLILKLHGQNRIEIYKDDQRILYHINDAHQLRVTVINNATNEVFVNYMVKKDENTFQLDFPILHVKSLGSYSINLFDTITNKIVKNEKLQIVAPIPIITNIKQKGYLNLPLGSGGVFTYNWDNKNLKQIVLSIDGQYFVPSKDSLIADAANYLIVTDDRGIKTKITKFSSKNIEIIVDFDSIVSTGEYVFNLVNYGDQVSSDVKLNIIPQFPPEFAICLYDPLSKYSFYYNCEASITLGCKHAYGINKMYFKDKNGNVDDIEKQLIGRDSIKLTFTNKSKDDNCIYYIFNNGEKKLWPYGNFRCFTFDELKKLKFVEDPIKITSNKSIDTIFLDNIANLPENKPIVLRNVRNINDTIDMVFKYKHDKKDYLLPYSKVKLSSEINGEYEGKIDDWTISGSIIVTDIPDIDYIKWQNRNDELDKQFNGQLYTTGSVQIYYLRIKFNENWKPVKENLKAFGQPLTFVNQEGDEYKFKIDLPAQLYKDQLPDITYLDQPVVIKGGQGNQGVREYKSPNLDNSFITIRTNDKKNPLIPIDFKQITSTNIKQKIVYLNKEGATLDFIIKANKAFGKQSIMIKVCHLNDENDINGTIMYSNTLQIEYDQTIPIPISDKIRSCNRILIKISFIKTDYDPIPIDETEYEFTIVYLTKYRSKLYFGIGMPNSNVLYYDQAGDVRKFRYTPFSFSIFLGRDYVDNIKGLPNGLGWGFQFGCSKLDNLVEGTSLFGFMAVPYFKFDILKTPSKINTLPGSIGIGPSIQWKDKVCYINLAFTAQININFTNKSNQSKANK